MLQNIALPVVNIYLGHSPSCGISLSFPPTLSQSESISCAIPESWARRAVNPRWTAAAEAGLRGPTRAYAGLEANWLTVQGYPLVRTALIPTKNCPYKRFFDNCPYKKNWKKFHNPFHPKLILSLQEGCPYNHGPYKGVYLHTHNSLHFHGH